MVELLCCTAGPVVRVRGDEEAHARSAACRLHDPPDHPPIGDVRIHDVEGLLRAVEELGDRCRDRSEPARCVVKHDRRHWAGALFERGEQVRNRARGSLAAEPAKAGNEHELQLCDDWALDTHEQVVELAVLEVILDSGSTDPADPTVDDDGLAVVDVP